MTASDDGSEDLLPIQQDSSRTYVDILLEEWDVNQVRQFIADNCQHKLWISSKVYANYYSTSKLACGGI